MASFVTVVDTSARRVKVKTTPEKSLSEVLQEACSIWRYNASLYGLKNNNKTLDLSRTVRLSGLSSGAKLELVKLSKTPSAVSVALQLPESDKEGVPNGRMTDKFASSISLWQLLRTFESATAGGLGTQKNFTGRGVPSIANGSSGGGRLYYEGPVLRIMGREYSSLTDLQKSLGSLGFNSGSVLLHLSFRTSEIPLEQAQNEIEEYFKSLEDVSTDAHGAHAGTVGNQVSAPEATESVVSEEAQESVKPPAEPSSPTEPVAISENDGPASTMEGILEPVTEQASHSPISSPPILGSVLSDPPENAEPAIETAAAINGEERKASSSIAPESMSDLQSEDGIHSGADVTGPGQRPTSVYAAPSSTTPQAARQTHNEQDYEPNIAQQQRYQAHLGKISQQQRLQSDKEIEDQQKAQVEKLSNIQEVDIKVRFPNQMQAVAKFSNLDTSTTLYEYVKGLMEYEDEPFSLNFSSAKGPKVIPKDRTVRLISDLGMVGRVLVNFIWDEDATLDARSGAVLKERFREAAQEIEVQEIQGTIEEKANLGWGRLGEGKSQGNGKPTGAMKLLNKLRKK